MPHCVLSSVVLGRPNEVKILAAAARGKNLYFVSPHTEDRFDGATEFIRHLRGLWNADWQGRDGGAPAQVPAARRRGRCG